MGCNTIITLPDNVRVRDVAKVIGIVSGLKPEWGGSGNADWVNVSGVTVIATCSVEMAEIVIEGDLVDGKKAHTCYYHFEEDKGSGRLLNPPSTAFWIAVARRLVDFFGGKINYQDTDDIDVDYERPAFSDRRNHPTANEEWDDFQVRLFNLKPITQKELKQWNKFAAYDKLEVAR